MVVLIVHVNEAERVSPSSTPSVRSAARCTAARHPPFHEGEHVRRFCPSSSRRPSRPCPPPSGFVGIPEEGTVGRSIYNAIDTKSVLYLIVYFLMIIGFSYFYATIQFNPVEISNNLKRNGGFIPASVRASPRLTSLPRFSTRSPFSAPSTRIVAICR